MIAFICYSLRASSPIWASDTRLARTRKRAAKLRGAGQASSREARFACPNRRACSQANRIMSTELKSRKALMKHNGKNKNSLLTGLFTCE